MYELKKIGTVFTSKFVWTGPSSYKKIIYWAAVSQKLRNTGLRDAVRKKLQKMENQQLVYLSRQCSSTPAGLPSSYEVKK